MGRQFAAQEASREFETEFKREARAFGANSKRLLSLNQRQIAAKGGGGFSHKTADAENHAILHWNKTRSLTQVRSTQLIQNRA